MNSEEVRQRQDDIDARAKKKFGPNPFDDPSVDTPQQNPVPGNRNVITAVMADMYKRAEFGHEKYGTYLMTFNGRDALMDAYQKAIDLVVYLKQAILERDGPAPVEIRAPETKMEVTKECPDCGSVMRVKSNRITGQKFLGCSAYPVCRHTESIKEELLMRAEGQPEMFDNL